MAIQCFTTVVVFVKADYWSGNVKIISNSFFSSPYPASVSFFIFLSFSWSLSAEAYGMLKKADKKGVKLTPAPYDHLIRALLAEGAIEDAMVVKDM